MRISMLKSRNLTFRYSVIIGLHLICLECRVRNIFKWTSALESVPTSWWDDYKCVWAQKMTTIIRKMKPLHWKIWFCIIAIGVICLSVFVSYWDSHLRRLKLSRVILVSWSPKAFISRLPYFAIFRELSISLAHPVVLGRPLACLVIGTFLSDHCEATVVNAQILLGILLELGSSLLWASVYSISMIFW